WTWVLLSCLLISVSIFECLSNQLGIHVLFQLINSTVLNFAYPAIFILIRLAFRCSVFSNCFYDYVITIRNKIICVNFIGMFYGFSHSTPKRTENFLFAIKGF